MAKFLEFGTKTTLLHTVEPVSFQGQARQTRHTETHNTEHAGICTSMHTASRGFLTLRTRCLEDPRRFWMQLAGPLSSTPTKS